MFPARLAPVLFGFVLSGLTSLIVSGIATARATGLEAGAWEPAHLWAGSWLSSWAVGFPTVLIVAPWARRLVGRLTRAADEPTGRP